MGRKPRITEDKWIEVKEARLSGMPFAALSKKFGISKTRIIDKIGDRSTKIKNAAESLKCVIDEIDSLPIEDRGSVVNLANELREISSNLASAARYGSVTAEKLAKLAAHKAINIQEDVDLEDCDRSLKVVLALTRTANEASSIGMGLVSTNKNMIENQANKLPIEEVRRRIAQLESRR
jgi:hypothetical protein